MWNVKNGKLYCGAETVAVRRGIVASVGRGSDGPVAPEKARRMVAVERALSLARLTAFLARAIGR
jgi:hypothetical protein